MSPEPNTPLEAAQKTVAILKDRVRTLYDIGPQTAIHRQLERGRERDEAARQKRAIMAAKNEELQRYSAELEVTVAKRTAELRAILDNVTFGFVVVDQEGKVQPGFTKSCADLFGQELTAGDDLVELLGVSGSTSDPMIRMGLIQVFDDFMPTEVTVEQIPSQFKVNGARIRTEYRAIRSEGGEVESVLITVSDVTSLWNAERATARNAALIRILQQKQAFAAYVADSRGRVTSCLEALDDQNYVRRSIHTIKGNSASYGIVDVAETAHTIEGAETIEASHIELLGAELEKFLSENQDVLGADLVNGSPSVEVRAEERQYLRLILDPFDVEAMESWGHRMLHLPAGDIVGPLDTLVAGLAERLDRRVDFHVEGADTVMDPTIMQPVLSTITHMLRNAVDHGLETEGERGEKPATGRLSTKFSCDDTNWVVEVEDDGRGIDVQRLTERAVERGDISQADADAMADSEKLNLIFLDGLSSRHEATELSGRGVGMAAVKEAAESKGGHVAVTSGPNGTRFRIEVPVTVH